MGKIQKQIMKPSIRTFYIKFFTVNKTWSAPPTPRLINNCHLSCNPLLSPTFCKSPKALTLFLILLFKVWDQTLSRRRGLILWTIATFLYLKKIYILSRKYSRRQIKFVIHPLFPDFSLSPSTFYPAVLCIPQTQFHYNLFPHSKYLILHIKAKMV